MVSETLRQSIRALYGFRCGYCSVTETESGGQLEIDHFLPRSQGGQDTLDNLVYACRACNSFKGDYWPPPGASPDLILLHPRKDDLSMHIDSLPDGRLIGLTKRGWFHIQRLRLNRAQLIELRLQRVELQRLRDTLEHSQQAQSQLQEHIRELEQEIERLLRIIAELTRL
ncbi:MAG: HNH endonuclease [Anaerolineae bacterium]|jgi:hypothetical protein